MNGTTTPTGIGARGARLAGRACPQDGWREDELEPFIGSVSAIDCRTRRPCPKTYTPTPRVWCLAMVPQRSQHRRDGIR